jgi:hypothetical protein
MFGNKPAANSKKEGFKWKKIPAGKAPPCEMPTFDKAARKMGKMK